MGFTKFELHIKIELFRTPFGTFQWKVMPFGANPHFIEHVLADEIDRGLVVVYIDDILKNVYLVQSLEFLGSIVGTDHVIPLFSHVKSIIDWPTPKNKSAVRSLMGTVKYCKDFIRNMAIIIS
ncbi:hypothetical protein ACTFIW_003646 [Dictyostelium discoideum]